LRVDNLLRTVIALFALTCGTAFANTQQTKPKTKSGTTAKHGKSTHAPRRTVQTAPTPERYREIQQALATKGYFKGEPNGRWGTDSIDALRRFQHDQNLGGNGKLDSVSLIALGLGPKRSLTAAETNSQQNQTRP
jgi:peptidoglycan hydrolase-like protein with peptidoglycan-binding domain